MGELAHRRSLLRRLMDALFNGVVWSTTALLLLVSIWFGGVSLWARARQRPFEPAAWRDAPEPDRVAMADDLVRRFLVGTTRAQIQSLLGAPPRTFAQQPAVAWWRVGPEAGPMSIDDVCIEVVFGADGLAAAARLRDC